MLNLTLALMMATTASVYDFKVESLGGGNIDFAAFKGKKILVVNTASECGYTPQYAGLQQLYKKYKERLVIVGFPANNFGKQEPGTHDEIAAFCKKNYGVTFPMAAKISVKGDDMHPLYRWLTDKTLNGTGDYTVRWNFHKFLIDEQGKIIGSFESKINPMGPELQNAIEH